MASISKEIGIISHKLCENLTCLAPHLHIVRQCAKKSLKCSEHYGTENCLFSSKLLSSNLSKLFKLHRFTLTVKIQVRSELELLIKNRICLKFPDVKTDTLITKNFGHFLFWTKKIVPKI